MNTYELVKAFNDKTADIAIEMNDIIIFSWSAKDNRNEDDGSYSNVLYYMPNDIAKAEIQTFEVIPQYIHLNDNEYVKCETSTLLIRIETYDSLYRYLEDDNYPFY